MRSVAAVALVWLGVLAACEPSGGGTPAIVPPPTTAHPVDQPQIPLDFGSPVDAGAPSPPSPTPDAGVAVVATPATTAFDAGTPPPPQDKCIEAKTTHRETCSKPEKQCNYADGVSCLCQTSQCVTPAGPVPNCEPKQFWTCRTDGCPMHVRGAACTKEGRQCTESLSFCSTAYTCRGAKYVQTGQPNCAPAARPHSED